MKTAIAYFIPYSFGFYAGTHGTPYYYVFIGLVVVIVFDFLISKIWKKLKGTSIKYQ